MAFSIGFPDGFRWGVTSSSIQAEGASPSADWYAWERDGRAPPSLEGSGFGMDFVDDFALLGRLGFTDVRIAAEWARIEPQPGKLDHSTLDAYSDMLGAARHAGLAPWVTLHATTLPGWFNEDEHGFRDAKMRTRYWMPHVDRCAEAFGEVAEGFVAVDDPIGWALRGYYLGSRPPGQQDPKLFQDAIEGALEADHLAAQHLAAGGLTTMAVRGVPSVFPIGPGAEPHVRWWAGVLFDTWVDVLDSGELAVPDRGIKIRPSWVDDFDYIGLSFDHPIGVDGEGGLAPYPASARRADNGFAPLPEELGVVLERLSERLPDRKFMIAANGVATRDDEWRELVLRETVEVVASAIGDGIRLHGYFHDAGIDGYEWRAGFNTQRGLIDRDRNVKESGLYLSSVMRASDGMAGDVRSGDGEGQAEHSRAADAEGDGGGESPTRSERRPNLRE